MAQPTLAQIAALFTDAPLLARVRGGMLVVANQVRKEDPATTDHQKRLLVAKRLINSPDFQFQQIMPAIVGHATIVAKAADPTTITDAEILSVLNDLLDDFV